MRDRARELLAEALALPIEERTEFAAELLASADDRESTADDAWATEIERRAHAAIDGRSTGRDWGEVKARLLAKLQTRR